MNDVSDLVHAWIEASNYIWRRWFAARAGGAYEFTELEQKLFEIMVIRQLGEDACNRAEGSLVNELSVEFLRDVSDVRQVCTQQQGGNIFCTPELVTVRAGSIHAIRDVDTMGTMMDSHAYVEVLHGNTFFLESPSSLRFFLAGKEK